MVGFFLNNDKSVKAIINDEGKLEIYSNHKNQRNSSRLVENLKNMTYIKKEGNKTVVYVKDIPFVEIDEKNVPIYKTRLTSFETRLLSQGKITENIPFPRREKIETKLATDLHTHFAGALPPEKLIKLGIGKEIYFNAKLLETAGIDAKGLHKNENDQYLLEDIIKEQSNLLKLINAMKIDTSEQETFNKMEEIYSIRGPLTKNPKLFIPIVQTIANDCKQVGIDYIELSLSSVISDVKQIEQLMEDLPKVEKETGVKIRFLGALWRHSDRERNCDEVDRLKAMAKSPYVVGCDFMGHETNQTDQFREHIYELAKYAILNDPDFIIRVHAGENPLFRANVRQVFLAIEEAHEELQKNSPIPLPYPQVRLGHGIYGFDEPAPWDESEKTKNISTIDLCKKLNAVIEFNMSSNLSLNNINSLKDIPIEDYIKQGISVVLGTDGRGIYSTEIEQEKILARQAGLELSDFEKILETEQRIKGREKSRFEILQHTTVEDLKYGQEHCYRLGKPQYTTETAEKYRKYYIEMQNKLAKLLDYSGAETDIVEIEKATSGKTPIMITGSSKKHWPKISEHNQQRIKNLFEVLSQVIDPEKAYIVTGGTNHGVEKEAHIAFHNHNLTAKNKTIILGTLTVEATQEENNEIEKDTITHAVIAKINNRPANRWFDLPDAVLDTIGRQKGVVLGIGGGPIVSDIIQRTHNLGISMDMLDNVEGASGEKCVSLAGNDYEFDTPAQLIAKLMVQIPHVIRQDLTKEDINKIIAQVCGTTEEKETYKKIDNIEEYVENLFTKGKQSALFIKSTPVNARKATVGEKVETFIKNKETGKLQKETEKVAEEGDWLVTNKGNETYLIHKNSFHALYGESEEEGQRFPVAKPRRLIQIDENIEFACADGEVLKIQAGGWLNINNMSKIYGINPIEFNETHIPYEQNKVNAPVES